MPSEIDLLPLFQNVVSALQNNRSDLNQADTYNNDHGDNMIEIFNQITQAIGDKKDTSAADQLAHAGKLLGGIKSGSAQEYAKGFTQAADQFQGQQLTTGNVGSLLQSLLGGGQAPAASTNSGDIFGSLLSGLTGGNKTDDPGLDTGDILEAGLAFFQSKQRGEGNLEAVLDAIVSGSSMGQVPHRAQSSKLVMDSLLQMLGPK